jgi:release factor glutamine methyltransferase
MTISAALAAATERLNTSSTSPRLDAEVLLAWLLDRNRIWLTTHRESPLTAHQLTTFRRLITRRRNGTPIPYLTGQAPFAGHQIIVAPGVLVPRPFTELLVEAVLEHIPKHQSLTIADVGTGSGCIAVTVAATRPAVRIIASDTSLRALRIARQNVQAMHLGRQVRLRRGSLTRAWTTLPNIVIANLPYLAPTQLHEPSIRREPRLALAGGGRDGLRLIERLLSQLQGISSINTIALELDPQQVRATKRLLRQWSPRCHIVAVTDGRVTRGLITTTTTPR